MAFFNSSGTVENYSLRDAGACAMEPRVSCCRPEPAGVSTYAQFIHRREGALEFRATLQPRKRSSSRQSNGQRNQMSEPARLEKPVRIEPARSAARHRPVRGLAPAIGAALPCHACASAVGAAFFGTDRPAVGRGVYYLLGTSLATGEGYRIPSEPGSPEALQYPPLLPALVALHQWALGTTDPAIVAPWLRRSYACLVRSLLPGRARPGKEAPVAWIRPCGDALCMLHIMTIFLSDLLFAELPFAVVSVVFALVAASGVPRSRPCVKWRRLHLPR